MSAPLLSVRGVKTFYGKIMALGGIDLDVAPGEIVTIIGANGAGKSTLTAVAASAGRPVLADDCVVVDLDDGHARANRGVPSIGVSPEVAAELGLAGPARPGDGGKLDIGVEPQGRAPISSPLRRIVLLGDRSTGGDLVEEAVGGATALAEVADQSHAGVHRLDPRALLERLGALVDAVPVVRARVPEGLDAARAALDRSGW